MKKVILTISSIIILSTSNSCSENDLQLTDPTSELITTVDSEDKLQKLLNAAYLNLGSVGAYGTGLMALGDVLSDHVYQLSGNAASYSTTFNMNYDAVTNDFNFYDPLYDAINSCNLVINNKIVTEDTNVKKIKAEAKIIRAFSYFTLVNYYSPTPTSGVNQEYGVPLVLGDYDASIEPARATVAEVYNQIITDLKEGIKDAADSPGSKVFMSKTVAKLLLSRVYLTRRAAGDAQLALQYSSEIVNNSPSDFAPINKTLYQNYFSGSPEATSENQSETIWEIDVNVNSISALGLGANLALPTLYYRIGDRKTILFTKEFYDSFPHSANGATSTDVRRGAAASGLLTTTGVGGTGAIPGAWTNKYPRLTEDGNFLRNIKVLRFAEAQLNRIEALYLTGQEGQALTELNTFALSRGGNTYSSSGVNLLNDILTEKGKEFYGEGQRFLDLKRWGLPLVKTSNCNANCNVPANSKLFILPISQSAINSNPNLKQYPGY